MTELSYIQKLVTETCCTCAIEFGVPADFQERRKSDKRSFYCPSGHSQSYQGKTKEQELRELQERLRLQKLETQRRQEQFFAEQRNHEATARRMRSLKKRVANGVCPCCQRTVSQLSRHMKTKHPGFVQHHKN